VENGDSTAQHASISAMSGTEFEAYVCAVLRSNGYLVALTRVTGDFGVDIVARRGAETTAVQCKRRASPVGRDAVREVVAGAVMYDCTSTMVVTNQTFNSEAVALAELHNCVLVDGSELARLAGIWWPDMDADGGVGAVRSMPKGCGARLGSWRREEMDMFEGFTHSARAAVVLAREEAGSVNAREIGPEHLLVGAVQSAVLSAALGGYGLTADVIRARLTVNDDSFEGDAEALRSIGIDLHAIRDGIARTFGPDAWDDALRKSRRRRRRRGHIPFARSAKKVLELALREALAHKDGSIGCEHIVLGILRGGDKFTMAIITEHVSATQLRESIVAVLDEAA